MIFHLAFSQCILTQTFSFLSFSVQIASRRPANEITFPHYRNLPFSFSCSLSCSQIQYWSFCSLGKRKMWTTAAAAATSALTLLIPLALPPTDRPTDRKPYPVLSGQTRELGRSRREKEGRYICPLHFGEGGRRRRRRHPAALAISSPLWAALALPSRRRRRRRRSERGGASLQIGRSWRL